MKLEKNRAVSIISLVFLITACSGPKNPSSITEVTKSTNLGEETGNKSVLDNNDFEIYAKNLIEKQGFDPNRPLKVSYEFNQELKKIDSEHRKVPKIDFAQYYREMVPKIDEGINRGEIAEYIVGGKSVEWTLLMLAIFEGNLGLTQYLVNSGAEVSNEELELATEVGHLEIVKFLVASGASLKDSELNLLKSVARNGQYDLLKYFEAQGLAITSNLELLVETSSANNRLGVLHYFISFCDCLEKAVLPAITYDRQQILVSLFTLGLEVAKDDNFMIKEASRLGHLDIVTLLIKQGADVTAGDNQAIINAALGGESKVVIELQKAGADINRAFEKIVELDRFDQLELLGGLGANINTRDSIALRKAALSGNLKAVKYLVSKGSDISAKDSEAIKSALNYGHDEVFKFLMKNSSVSVLSELVTDVINKENFKNLKKLIELGLDVEFNNNEMIETASLIGSIDMVRYLTEHGADFRVKEDICIKYAATQGHLEVIKYLFENGADLNLGLIEASIVGSIETLDYLISLGGDVTAYDNQAIQEAAESGNLEKVKYLVEKGADAFANKNNAIKLAKEKGHKEVVDYLQSLRKK